MKNVETVKLYMPLMVTTYEYENEYGDIEYDDYPSEINNSVVKNDMDKINALIEKLEGEDFPKEGYMAYYSENDSLKEKVESYHLRCEVVENEVYGVAIVELNEDLTEEEWELLKEDVIGQCSDGIGEVLEQKELDINDQKVSVHLWNDGRGWSLQTAEELGFEEQQQQDFEMGGM